MFKEMKKLHTASASLLLLLLISADIAFLLFHTFNRKFEFSPLLSIYQEGGYAEIFQYLKYFWAIILLSYLAIILKLYGLISWIVIFIYFFFDDAFQIHETFGDYAAKRFNYTPLFGLRPQDFGELTILATSGIILLSILGFSYWLGSETFKKISNDMILLMLALVFFGIIIDIAHIGIHLGSKVSFILGAVEDGGEMGVVSLMVWYLFHLAIQREHTRLHFHELIISAVKKAKPSASSRIS